MTISSLRKQRVVHCTPDNIALVTKFRATICSNVVGFYANFAGNNSISSEFTHTKLHHAIRVAPKTISDAFNKQHEHHPRCMCVIVLPEE